MAPSQHVLDANTVCLWRFDGAGPTHADLGPLNLTLTESVDAQVTTVAGKFGNGVSLSQKVGTVYQGLTSAYTTALRTTFLGNYTLEFWVYFNGAPEAIFGDILVSYRGHNGTYPSSNALIGLTRLPSRTLSFGWLYGSTPSVASVASTGTLADGVWHHVACVKELSGATYTAKIYINGVLDNTATALPNTDGGTDATVALVLGFLYKDTHASLYTANCIFDDVRISNVVRSPAIILYDATGVGAGISVIRVAPELNGQNFGVPYLFAPLCPAPIVPNTFTPENLQLLSTQESYLKLTLTFSDTLDALGSYINPGLWAFTTSATPITATSVSLSGATVTIAHTEPSLGENYILNIPAGAISKSGRISNVPSTTSFAGAGQVPVAYSAIATDPNHFLLQFSEAVSNATATNILNYSLDPALNVVSIVSDGGSPSKYIVETGDQTSLEVYSVTISNVEDLAGNPILTPAEIPVQFFGFANSSSTPPVIDNMLPTPGTNLAPSQPITFTVTDDTGFSALVLALSIPEKGISEVIHNGISFSSRYLGASNTRTAIPFGYEFSILRDGGWPGNVNLIPYVLDLEGQG